MTKSQVIEELLKQKKSLHDSLMCARIFKQETTSTLKAIESTDKAIVEIAITFKD